jgi:glycine hydroxymethyltransferase
MLIDLSNKGVTGKEAEDALDKAGITVNKNAIPFDARPPAVTSGMRLGTPCVTTRGMGEAEMADIAEIIDEVLSNRDDGKRLQGLREKTKALCQRFPVY